MHGSPTKEVAKPSRYYLSHIPIPYGCLTVVALAVAALTVLVVSSFAIGAAISK
ncbi:MAG TPA: hypothetical protein VIH78_02385 [Terriglobales bacterium]|jgi:hypothetical protein